MGQRRRRHRIPRTLLRRWMLLILLDLRSQWRKWKYASLRHSSALVRNPGGGRLMLVLQQDQSNYHSVFV